MVQVYVPAGEFIMGSNDGDDDEKPEHKVYLDDYWIDQTEVTNAMYVEFLNKEGNQGVNWLDEDGMDARIQNQGGTWQAGIGYENHPVIEVSWNGAQAYCTWAGGRLPTEAEWEKAARGTDERTYPWEGQSPSAILLN